MNPLNNPRVEILESGNELYDCFVDAKLFYIIRRQPIFPRLWMAIGVSTNSVVDTDQYRTDLFERIAAKYPTQ